MDFIPVNGEVKEVLGANAQARDDSSNVYNPTSSANVNARKASQFWNQKFGNPSYITDLPKVRYVIKYFHKQLPKMRQI